MSDAFEKLRSEYKRSLHDYLETSSETLLEEAYEIGRKAIGMHIGILEMKAIHNDTINDNLMDSDSETEVIEKKLICERFFEECLASYDMAERGFQESKDELQILNKSLNEQIEKSTADLRLNVLKFERIIEQVVETIVFMGETRDAFTSGHELRVSELAVAIGSKLDLTEEQMEAIRLAGKLHDVGKIAIPLEILFKPGRLSDEEMSIIRTHSIVGHKILRRIEFPYPIADIVLQNHERLDGSGYPYGLKSKDIMIEAKILAVADTVEAMTSHRPYRPAFPIDNAIREISKNAGVLYDRDVVDVCVSLFENGHFKYSNDVAA